MRKAAVAQVQRLGKGLEIDLLLHMLPHIFHGIENVAADGRVVVRAAAADDGDELQEDAVFLRDLQRGGLLQIVQAIEPVEQAFKQRLVRNGVDHVLRRAQVLHGLGCGLSGKMQVEGDRVARSGKGVHLPHVRQEHRALSARQPRLRRADLNVEPSVLQIKKVEVPPPV